MTEPTAEQMRAFRILLERTLGDKESGLVLVASPHPGFVDLKMGGPNGGHILSRLSVEKIVTESRQKLREEAPKTDMFGGLENLIGSFFEDFGPLGHSDVSTLRETVRDLKTALASSEKEREHLLQEVEGLRHRIASLEK